MQQVVGDVLTVGVVELANAALVEKGGELSEIGAIGGAGIGREPAFDC